MGDPTPRDAARFVVKTVAQPETGCRAWQAAIGKDGYGRFYFQGRTVYAHVFAYRLGSGAWPPAGVDLAHTCERRDCVNHLHLKPLDRQTHATFDAALGRRSAGHLGNSRRARFTDAEVLDIRTRLAVNESTTALAEDYEVTDVTIGKIGAGKSYKRVGGPRTNRLVGRPRGKRNRRSKLVVAQVHEIRRRCNEPAVKLAAEFGVSRRQIDDIVKGRSWAHLEASPAPVQTAVEENLLHLDLRTRNPLPDSAEEVDLLDRLVAAYKAHGFPYVRQSDVERAVESVRRSGVLISADGVIGRSTAGMGLATSFHPRMEDVRCREKKTPLEAFNDETVLRAVLLDALRREDYLTPAKLRKLLRVHSGVQAPSNFQPVAMRLLCERFQPKLVVDPCAGWGGRLLGCAAAGVNYVGVDVCQETIDGNQALAAALQPLVPSSMALHCARAETWLADTSLEPDLIFTSPPYFDTEHYDDHPDQSFLRYPTLSKWRDGFLGPLVDHAFDRLTPGGHLVLNVPDEMVTWLVARAATAGFSVLEPLALRLGGRRSGSPRTEPVLVFQRCR